MNTKTRIYGLCLGAALLAATAGSLAIAEEKDEVEVKVALPVEQVIACVRAAVAAKPGNVRGVEAESEKGRVLCEVEIVAADGALYEVSVEVATGKVVEIEAEDGEDNDD